MMKIVALYRKASSHSDLFSGHKVSAKTKDMLVVKVFHRRSYQDDSLIYHLFRCHSHFEQVLCIEASQPLHRLHSSFDQVLQSCE